jgi:Tfp pilus assembly protein FimT
MNIKTKIKEKISLHPKRKSTTRRSFSLLELFVVLAIVAIVFTLMATRNSISTFRAKENSEKLFSTLRFCHQMALTHNCDIFLSIKQSPLEVTLHTDEKHGLFKQRALHAKKFEDLYLKFDTQEISDTQIIFYASGDISFQGKIFIYQTNDLSSPIKTIDLSPRKD